MMTVSYALDPKKHQYDQFVPWQALLNWLGRVVTGLVAALLMVPVLLLLVNTSVPRLLALLLLVADGTLLWVLARYVRTTRMALVVLVALVAIALLSVGLSQALAATPPIVDGAGKPLPNSIAVMEKVVLGGSEQWITIRGQNVENPVLLYLGIGGPGAGGMPASALTLAPLEEHFVVVNWDQPGTGKSYGAVKHDELTVERVVADARELTELMRARFGEQKIYVFGLSWGTIVGIQLVEQYPELYHAYIGNGQMVNTTENDQIGYEFALEHGRAQGNTATVRRLERNGPPPYAGQGMALKYADYNNVLFRYMQSPTLGLILALVPQMAREYGLWDRVNFARGLIDTFPVLYPQLRELDFTTQAASLQVPVYFLVGRNDINAVASLVERYYGVLDAPHKELIWLEGGHGATPEQIRDVLVNRVLAQVDVRAE